MTNVATELLEIGNALGTGTKSYVDLLINPGASATDRKAAIYGAIGVASTISENYFADIRNSPISAATSRALGGTFAGASLQVSWTQFSEAYAAWRDNPSDANQKVLIEKFAGYSASVGVVIAAVLGGMRWVLRSLTHRRYRPSRPCSC